MPANARAQVRAVGGATGGLLRRGDVISCGRAAWAGMCQVYVVYWNSYAA